MARAARRGKGASSQAATDGGDGTCLTKFEAVLKDLRGFRHHMMDLLVNKVINLFQRNCQKYFEQWHNHENKFDGSNRETNLMHALSRHKMLVKTLTLGLANDCIGDVMRVISIRIDHNIFEHVIIGTVFTSNAVDELQHDLNAIWATHRSIWNGQYSSQGYYRLCIESLSLLSMRKDNRQSLGRTIIVQCLCSQQALLPSAT